MSLPSLTALGFLPAVDPLSSDRKASLVCFSASVGGREGEGGVRGWGVGGRTGEVEKHINEDNTGDRATTEEVHGGVNTRGGS